MKASKTHFRAIFHLFSRDNVSSLSLGGGNKQPWTGLGPFDDKPRSAETCEAVMSGRAGAAGETISHHYSHYPPALSSRMFVFRCPALTQRQAGIIPSRASRCLDPLRFVEFAFIQPSAHLQSISPPSKPPIPATPLLSCFPCKTQSG